MLYINHGNVGYTVMDSLIINSEFVIMTFASPRDVKYNHPADIPVSMTNKRQGVLKVYET